MSSDTDARGTERFEFENWPRRQRWFARILFGIMGTLVGQPITPVYWWVFALAFAWIGPYALEWLFDPDAGGEAA